MFTLLSEQQKKRLYKEYRIRLLSLVAFFIAALLFIASAMLIPSRMMLAIERDALLSEKQVYDQTISNQNSKDLIKTLDDIKLMLRLAKPEDTALLKVIESILVVRPSDVGIRSIAYTRGTEGPSSVTLQGIAGTRANLINFFKILQKDPRFTESALPVGSLAKETSVSYTINLKGEF